MRITWDAKVALRRIGAVLLASCVLLLAPLRTQAFGIVSRRFIKLTLGVLVIVLIIREIALSIHYAELDAPPRPTRRLATR